MANTTRPRSSPRMRYLLPAEHEALVNRLGRRLDAIESDLADIAPGRCAKRLQRRRLRLLRDLVNAEADHAEACEPLAFHLAACGVGVVVTCRGGWATWLPTHTAEDMEVAGIDHIAF